MLQLLGSITHPRWTLGRWCVAPVALVASTSVLRRNPARWRRGNKAGTTWWRGPGVGEGRGREVLVAAVATLVSAVAATATTGCVPASTTSTVVVAPSSAAVLVVATHVVIAASIVEAAAASSATTATKSTATGVTFILLTHRLGLSWAESRLGHYGALEDDGLVCVLGSQSRHLVVDPARLLDV